MGNKIVMVDTWYDRHQRIWVTQLKDEEGNQVGNAIYSWNKKEAIANTKDLKSEYGIK